MSQLSRMLILFLGSLSVLLLSACGNNDNAEPAQKPADANTLTILFAYGSEKKAWVNDATQIFNRAGKRLANGKKIQVREQPMGSGELTSGLLDGSLKAHLASPASDAFVKLGNAESQIKSGKDIFGATQPLVLSPVVIAMWKPMAEALGWGKKPISWKDIIKLAKDPKGWASYGYPQWGKFKFGHTHPDYSNSGLISLFAEVYAGAGKVAGLTVEDVRNPQTAEYLHDIEQAVVHYGRSTGFFGHKLMDNGPGYLSAAVLYENMVIESYKRDNLPFPIVAIYPKEGTFWSDHPAGVVNAPWVSAEQKQAAEIYLQFLLDKQQQQRALAYGFRPADVQIPLAAPIDARYGVNPEEPKTTLEVPSVTVMNEIKQLWYQQKRHANVVLVLDTSGSMSGEKMDNARKGAVQLLDMLGEADNFSLLSFNSQPQWVEKDTKVQAGRTAAKKHIEGLFASGGTALYDAIAEAHKHLSQKSLENISAIVVLSDGADSNSQKKLFELRNQVELDAENQAIRIFPIGYGSGARMEVLEQIANATQTKAYKGTPQSINAVFREISTFF